MSDTNPSEVSDTGGTDSGPDDAAQRLSEQAALVGPILNELFRKSAEGEDYWLKKKSLQLLTDWIMSVQDIATLLTQQLEAAQTVIAAQEKELEELRPDKGKMWTPF